MIGFQSNRIIEGINFRNTGEEQASHHYFFEILFVDKSYDAAHPLAYQLNVSPYHDLLRSSEEISFTMMGEILNIDKHYKIVHLTNSIKVSYKYLIIMWGLGQNFDQFFLGGVNALIKSLKIRKNVSEFLKFSEIIVEWKKQKVTTERSKVQQVMVPPLENALSFDQTMNSVEKCMYELFL